MKAWRIKGDDLKNCVPFKYGVMLILYPQESGQRVCKKDKRCQADKYVRACRILLWTVIGIIMERLSK